MSGFQMPEWLFWRLETSLLFGTLFIVFIILAIWDLRSRSEERKGFLPVSTSRGDRFFWGMLATILIGMFWLRFVPEAIPFQFMLIPSAVAFAIIWRWG